MTVKTLTQKIHKKLALLHGELFLRPKAVNVIARHLEWDVLIILDGCRFDTFKKINHLSGVLSSIISLGSCTPEWAQKAFSVDSSEILYVSANPFISKQYLTQWFRKVPFFHLVEIWDKGWDTDLKTVKAETVFNIGEKMVKQFPDKKVVLHCMQPHHPFIGKKSIREKGWKLHNESKEKTVYEMLQSGDVSRTDVITAYEENLRYILTVIDKSKFLRGKRVVITADHGNCFGKYGVYAHPKGLALPELLKVPWFEVDTL